MTEVNVIFEGEPHSFQPGQTVRIGRSLDNEIVISNPAVSRQHAQLTWAGDHWMFENVGRAATYLNGDSIVRVPITGPVDLALAAPAGPALHIEPAPSRTAVADVPGHPQGAGSRGPGSGGQGPGFPAGEAAGLAAAGAAGAAGMAGGPGGYPAGPGGYPQAGRGAGPGGYQATEAAVMPPDSDPRAGYPSAAEPGPADDRPSPAGGEYGGMPPADSGYRLVGGDGRSARFDVPGIAAGRPQPEDADSPGGPPGPAGPGGQGPGPGDAPPGYGGPAREFGDAARGYGDAAAGYGDPAREYGGGPAGYQPTEAAYAPPARPGAGADRPGADQPGADQPGTGQPGADQPGSTQWMPPVPGQDEPPAGRGRHGRGSGPAEPAGPSGGAPEGFPAAPREFAGPDPQPALRPGADPRLGAQPDFRPGAQPDFRPGAPSGAEPGAQPGPGPGGYPPAGFPPGNDALAGHGPGAPGGYGPGAPGGYGQRPGEPIGPGGPGGPGGSGQDLAGPGQRPDGPGGPGGPGFGPGGPGQGPGGRGPGGRGPGGQGPGGQGPGGQGPGGQGPGGQGPGGYAPGPGGPGGPGGPAGYGQGGPGGYQPGGPGGPGSPGFGPGGPGGPGGYGPGGPGGGPGGPGGGPGGYGPGAGGVPGPGGPGGYPPGGPGGYPPGGPGGPGGYPPGGPGGPGGYPPAGPGGYPPGNYPPGGYPPGYGPGGYPPPGAPGAYGGPGHGRGQPGAASQGDVMKAINILVPIKSWLTDSGWRSGPRLLVIPYALLPLLFLVLFNSSTSLTTPGWAYSLYIAPLWLLVFWLLIRPGHIGRQEMVIGVGIIAWVLLWMNIVTININDAVAPKAGHAFSLGAALVVGYNEEITKALPILVAAFIMLKARNTKLDVRMWMFLGTLAGLVFGVDEQAAYTTNALANVLKIGIIAGRGGNVPPRILEQITVGEILSFSERVFVDGFQHAMWAGVSAFFIGVAINYPRRRWLLILLGITIPAVLHALNDWSIGFFHTLWPWVIVQAVSVVVFLGYAFSAGAIVRQVKHTPMFRGESMLMDVVSEQSMVSPPPQRR